MTAVLFFVDVEAPKDAHAPCEGHMTEFGIIHYDSYESFHGRDDSLETMVRMHVWIVEKAAGGRPVFVSDNPAYDWQWINDACWRHLGTNPFGHSARRISDYYAGLVNDWRETQKWKRLRRTEHDHNPVHDALGNAEAFKRLQNGER
jgi:hypothetical protein